MSTPLEPPSDDYRPSTCHFCHITFDSHALMFAHKQEQMALGKGHIHCRVCELSFRSPATLDIHMKRTHPKEQHLVCPGCKKIFRRAGQLMQHIEADTCSAITQTDVEKSRTAKMKMGLLLTTRGKKYQEQFSEFLGVECQPEHVGTMGWDKRDILELSDLESKHILDAALPVQSHIGPHMATLSFTLARQTASTAPEVGIVNADSFPPLPRAPATTGDVAAAQSTGCDGDSAPATTRPWFTNNYTAATSPGAAERTEKGGSEKTKESSPTPDPEETAVPAWATANNLTTSHKAQTVGQVPGTLTIDDPFHPRFNPMRYWNSVTGKFHCPQEDCFASMKKVGGIIYHLKTGIHNTPTQRLQCPRCFRYFKSTASLVHHSEAEGSRCNAQQAENFTYFFDQLTGGVLDIDGKHDDDTNRYVVSMEAVEKFGTRHRARAGARTKPAPGPQPKSWDSWDAKVDW